MEDGVTPPLLITEKDTTMIRVKEEVTKQLWLSAPLIGVSLLQYTLQVMFVGHLGSLSPLSLPPQSPPPLPLSRASPSSWEHRVHWRHSVAKRTKQSCMGN